MSFQVEAELQELYFEPLVKKEQMEEKMRNIKEVACRVVTCRTVSRGSLTAGPRVLLGWGGTRGATSCDQDPPRTASS